MYCSSRPATNKEIWKDSGAGAVEVEGAVEVHFPMLGSKSARAYDLIVDQGMNSMESALSSTDHLTTRPLASRLWRMSPSGKENTILT
jgi:hypothetical protein